MRKLIAHQWVMFTKRTNDPKLAFLEKELARHGIKSRRNGESFHAPILEVKRKDLDKAWTILTPIDVIDDDDPRFSKEAPHA
jgi:hypothetical protein